MKDLWPDNIQSSLIETPVSILRKQASFLGNKTNNVIEAKVEVRANPSEEELSRALSALNGDDYRPQKFSYSFYLDAPTLGYRYRLFSVNYMLDLYPVNFVLDDDIEKEIIRQFSADPTIDKTQQEREMLVANSKEEFIDIFEKILHSKKTKRVIQSLISQVDQN